MTNLEATKLARQALRNAGIRGQMYTNKYKTMRTVKAYCSSGPKARQRIMDALEKAFGDNMPQADIEKVKPIYRWQQPYTRVIVRFPFDETEQEIEKVKANESARRKLLRDIEWQEESIEELEKDLVVERKELAKLKAKLEAMG